MMPPEKVNAMRILKKELEELQKDPIITLGVTVGEVQKGDVFHWQITMLGPQDTPYANGLFYLIADFPDNYPIRGPKIRFKNQMYHLNVSSMGDVCISTLTKWAPGTTMSEVLSLIFALFYKQNPKDPYDSKKAELFIKDRKAFDEKAREYTKKFASFND